jgi:hypothetical protein
MSGLPRVLLTIEDGDMIVAKRFRYLSNELMGIAALCDDGTHKLFAVKSNPTNAEFHDIKVAADASYEEKKRAIVEATDWEDEEFPWLETDENGDAVPGTDTPQRVTDWLNAEIDIEQLESWGETVAGPYAPGFVLMDALTKDERRALGLREQDNGGPASSVLVVTTTASIEELNDMLSRKNLPFIFIDDEGPGDDL